MDASLDLAIRNATSLLRKRGVGPHIHSARCQRLTRHILANGEEIIFEAKQSILESMTPTRMMATNRRILLISPSFWGLYFGFDLIRPTDYSIMPYKYVVGVTLSKSKMLTTMKIHTSADVAKNQETGSREENEIRGVRSKDAVLMATFIDEVVESESGNYVQHTRSEELNSTERAGLVGLNEAMENISRGDKFIWLGMESAEEVAIVLGVSKEKVIKISPEHMLELNERQIRGMADSSMLVSYNVGMANHVSSLLKKKFGVEMRVLHGGISSFAELQSKIASNFLQRTAD